MIDEARERLLEDCRAIARLLRSGAKIPKRFHDVRKFIEENRRPQAFRGRPLDLKARLDRFWSEPVHVAALVAHERICKLRDEDGRKYIRAGERERITRAAIDDIAESWNIQKPSFSRVSEILRKGRNLLPPNER